jgi:hypothetical protein
MMTTAAAAAIMYMSVDGTASGSGTTDGEIVGAGVAVGATGVVGVVVTVGSALACLGPTPKYVIAYELE